MENEKPLKISPGEREALYSADVCTFHICEGVIEKVESGERPPVDHCHLTGKIRGLAHPKCNLAYQIPNYIPIFLHGGSNYDFRLLVSKIVSSDIVEKVKITRKPVSRKSKTPKKAKRARNEFLDDEAEVEDGSEGSDSGEDNDGESMNGFINDEELESDNSSDCESVKSDASSMIGRGMIRKKGMLHSDVESEDEDEYMRESSIVYGMNTDDEEEELQPIMNEPGFIRNRKRNGGLRVIANSSENFISFQVPITKNLSIRFFDSFRFLQASLGKLASYLDKSEMKFVREYYNDEEAFNVATRKGVFPYEYISDFSKYLDSDLPPKKKFFSILTGSHISDEEYAFAQKVWRILKCKNLGDYNDHYLRIDVLLLCDIFERFRSHCHKIYKIDPAHCYTAPSLAFNAMLKTVKRPLPLLTDYNKLLMIESGIRGGFCNVSKRHVVASNRYTSRDPNIDGLPENYLLYIDANNLYGWSMSQYFPDGNFEWVKTSNLFSLRNKIPTHPDDAAYGYILEVDLEIPNHLHDKFSDFPLCPENLATTSKKNGPRKLIASLHKKTRYVLHYAYLKTVLEQGVRLVKVHRAISFTQSPWMRNYIMLNTELRKKSTNEFEKNFYKLMVNSVYGKTMENVRSRRDFKLSYKPYLVQRWINKPNFKNRIILDEESNLHLIEMEKTKIKFDKMIYCGLIVLDLSKKLMADFHYDLMKRLFPEPGAHTMCYTDTDSFIYEIKYNNGDMYKTLAENKQYFDFSDYPKDHPCYDITNKKTLGKFKDEACGKILLEYIGLKPKMYAHQTFNDKVCKKVKGIKKCIVEKIINIQDYLDALYKNENVYVEQYAIQSKKHKVYTIAQQKLAISSNDDKRYILLNNIDTLPWGHYSIPKENDLILLCNQSNQKYLNVPPPPHAIIK